MKLGRQHICFYEWPATDIVWPASKRGRTDTAKVVGVGVFVRECERACVHACVRDVFAIYDNDILPRLIMIIIKIIILYFIQIRHTDDFPSTGTRLVQYKFQLSPDLLERLPLIIQNMVVTAVFVIGCLECFCDDVTQIFSAQTNLSVLCLKKVAWTQTEEAGIIMDRCSTTVS